jgi:imidazoleglycerol phosphate dehydratase HisB
MCTSFLALASSPLTCSCRVDSAPVAIDEAAASRQVHLSGRNCWMVGNEAVVIEIGMVGRGR